MATKYLWEICDEDRPYARQGRVVRITEEESGEFWNSLPIFSNNTAGTLKTAEQICINLGRISFLREEIAADQEELNSLEKKTKRIFQDNFSIETKR